MTSGAGASGVIFGGPGANLVEPQRLTVNRFYEVLWKKQEIDLTVLAKLRWVDKWSIELALSIRAGEILVDLTYEMRGAAIKAHVRGPISHLLFKRQLTGK